ncbi:hypothetical protein B296_00057265 [Ensete ventricosum]|uniref:Uncharacterized protein n=1 Tax=Ensete ventricosum TaxID=4639 RepID=A0A426X0G6_ENSVE|nr:hypothetical protein B296_00057265 [Ensete ventricosum]
MDLDELHRMPKVSSGKAPPTRPAAWEVGASPTREAPKASSKRSVDAPTEQVDDAARRHKKVKVLTRSRRTHIRAAREARQDKAGERRGTLKARGLGERVARGPEQPGRCPRLLKEARVRARKMDDELLQAVKALESARAELPRQSVVQYKELLGFKEGLKRMGRVTYEYRYRVALARFHARHPDTEVEEYPFTIHPEDDLVPMERQQAFDDLVPPEPHL